MPDEAAHATGNAVNEPRSAPWFSAGVLLVCVGLPIALAALVEFIFREQWSIFLPLWVGWFLLPCGILLFMYSIHRASSAARKRNGELIVGHLETAVRLNLPLSPFLLAAERSEKGRPREQLRLLRTLLESGMPVWAALWKVPDMPEDVAARVAAFEPIGQLRLALGTTVQRQRSQEADQAWDSRTPVYRFYGAFLILALVVLIAWFMIRILPMFREIFKDQKTALPWITELFFFSGGGLGNGYLPILLIVAVVMGAAIAAVAARMFFFPLRRVPLLDHASEWLAWRIPVVQGLQRDRDMSELCGLLSVAMRNGVPFPAALLRAAALPLNLNFRRSLTIFREELERGAAPADAAQKARLPKLLVGMLAPLNLAKLQSPGAEMFEFLARYYRLRFSRTLMTLRAAGEPLLVLFLGSIVMVFVVAVMKPLADLIAHMSRLGPGGGL